MRSFRPAFMLLLLFMLISTSRREQNSLSEPEATDITPDVIITLPTTPATATFPVPTSEVPTATSVLKEKEFEDFNANDFPQSGNIYNPWLPLIPGTQLIYDGQTEENGVLVPHRLIITVTNLTKVIDGVRSVVNWDQDFKAGELVESELAFFAQDRYGNVWRMGEHPEEYDNGQYVDAPTWFAGINYSVPGIEMLGKPQVGTPSYSQGWAPSVGFTDRGQVSQVGQSVCVPAGCYENVLVIDETSQAEPGAHQLKLFARGVGNIKVDWRGADQTQEILELTQMVQLNSIQLASARISALQEERHAYEVSRDVYGKTPPAE